MARTKITAYVTPEIADTLKRVAAIEDRSFSDIIEDAIVRRLNATGGDAEHAALMARLDQVQRRLGVIEKGQQTHFELSAQTSRFLLSVAPEIAEADRPALAARGADRFRNIMALAVSRLASGGALQDALAHIPVPEARPSWREAAE
jgi:hypothetical protein